MDGNGGGSVLSGELFDDHEFVGQVWESEIVEGTEFRNCSFTDVSVAGSSLASCLFHECTFSRCDLAGATVCRVGYPTGALTTFPDFQTWVMRSGSPHPLTSSVGSQSRAMRSAS